jgi:pilin glycosylation protein pglB
LMSYLPLYNDFQFRRHEMRPGVTGWAQVNGRNAISWDEKFAYDIWYIDHFSLWFDMKILFLTIKKVFIKEGISAEGEATMPYFTGNDSNEQKG